MHEPDEPRASGDPADEPRYPVTNYLDARRELRRPPPAAAVGFHTAETNDDKTAALVLSGTSVTRVCNLLDHVCGEHWSHGFLDVPDSLRPRGKQPVVARCRMVVFGVPHEGIGEGHDAKTAATDSIKRAAEVFGVNRVLREQPPRWLRVGEADHELRPDENGEPFVDERTERYLRERYRSWARRLTPTRRYGQVLDLGERAQTSSAQQRRRLTLVTTPPTAATNDDPPANSPEPARGAPSDARALSPAAADPTASTAGANTEIGEPLTRWLRNSRYSRQIADQLAALCHGLSSASELDAKQEADICGLLGRARACGWEEAKLGPALARLLDPDNWPDRRDASDHLRQTLAQRLRERHDSEKRAA